MNFSRSDSTNPEDFFFFTRFCFVETTTAKAPTLNANYPSPIDMFIECKLLLYALVFRLPSSFPPWQSKQKNHHAKFAQYTQLVHTWSKVIFNGLMIPLRNEKMCCIIIIFLSYYWRIKQGAQSPMEVYSFNNFLFAFRGSLFVSFTFSHRLFLS